MKTETVTRREWNIMVDELDGDLQESLNEDLKGWLGGVTCKHVEYRPDSLGRLDSESNPCPGKAMNSDQIESMIQHKIDNGCKVNLVSFNLQLRELGCSAGERRAVRNRISRAKR